MVNIVYVTGNKPTGISKKLWEQVRRCDQETIWTQIRVNFTEAEDPNGKVPNRRIADPRKLSDAIIKICRENAAGIVLLDETVCRRETAVKTAAGLDGRCLFNVTGFEREQDGICCVREAYQANMHAFCHIGTVPLISMWKGAEGGNAGTVPADRTQDIFVEAKKGQSVFLRKKEMDNELLFQEETILICGHGVGGKANVSEIAEIARNCGFGIAATRPVVTSGWLPSGCLIGISGRSIAPQNVVALGVSGSQAFMAGVQGSGRIIAVNTDRSAPVFQKCDFGIVGDCMEFARSLTEE